MADLFPGVVAPKPDRKELIDLLEEACVSRKLQPTSWYLEKIVQIYEMLLVRHGLMIVGEPMGGKTNAYQVRATIIVVLTLRCCTLVKDEPAVVRILI